MRASARLSVREISISDMYIYDRVLPKESLLLDCRELIDWDQFNAKLLAYYSDSGEGQPPYPPGILLKIEFLGYLYGMGRRALIERATCDLHWKFFLGLPIDAALPDHSTLSHFRSRLGAEGFKEIFDALILQARGHGLISDRLRLKDATHIYADIAVPTALGLFAQLRQRILAAVKAFDPCAAESFELALRLVRERSEGDDDTTRLQARVELVQDIVAWITEQNQPADPTTAKAWQKLQEVRRLAEKILSDLGQPERDSTTPPFTPSNLQGARPGEDTTVNDLVCNQHQADRQTAAHTVRAGRTIRPNLTS